MPPKSSSRYLFCRASEDEAGRRSLTTRAPFRFRTLADTRTHVVSAGDTLWTLAERYFSPLPRAAGFWWAIADFQPEPILDPTVVLDVGRVLFIPSSRVLTDVILGETRRREF